MYSVNIYDCGRAVVARKREPGCWSITRSPNASRRRVDGQASVPTAFGAPPNLRLLGSISNHSAMCAGQPGVAEKDGGLAAVLVAAELPPTMMGGTTLSDLQTRLTAGRSEFLASLKPHGLNVGQRQRLANAVSRSIKENLSSAPSTARKCRVATAAEAISAGHVALVTLTNSGYLAYTANCLTSLELVGEAPALSVYCADDGSHNALSADASMMRAVQQLVPLHEEALCGFLAWKEKGWPRLMWLKCEVMRRALAQHEFVVFTDGDIVYERPGAVAYCIERLLHHAEHSGLELLMQNDGLDDTNTHGWGLCAGFMAARSTPATLAAFTVDESILSPGWDDQRHLNAVRDRLNVEPLPLALFPNGQYWARHKESLGKEPRSHSPFLIHYNWVTGGEKRAWMESDGRWYVSRRWDGHQMLALDPCPGGDAGATASLAAASRSPAGSSVPGVQITDGAASRGRRYV